MQNIYTFLIGGMLYLLPSISGFGQVSFQNNNYTYIDRFTDEDGLSQVNVTSMLKDSDGFMWIGTEEGLNRFDGYNFEIFRHDENNIHSIGDNKVYCLYEDTRGRLWIGTNLGGLQLYDRHTRQFKRLVHDPDNINSLSYNTIQYILEDHTNNLWIGTNQGLNLMDHKNDTIIRFYKKPDGTGLAGNHVTSIIQCSHRNIWIGTLEGLSVLDRVTFETKNYYHDEKKPGSLGHNAVLSVFMDSEGKIWIGTEGGGLSLYKPEEDSFINFMNDPDYMKVVGASVIHTINEDDFGNIWFGTWGRGVGVYSKQDGKFYHLLSENDDEFNNAIVYEIENTNDGNMWVGTYEAGVAILSKKRKKFTHIKSFDKEMEVLGRNTVRAIIEDRNKNIWIGTDGSGLYKYNRDIDQFKHYSADRAKSPSISGSIVKTLLEDEKGNIYAGTYAAGLNYIDPVTDKTITYLHDSENSNSINGNSIWALHMDSDHTIWIGTLGGGLDKFIPAERKFIHYVNDPHDPKSVSSNRISKLYEDSRGNFWVGTIDGGICKMLKDKHEFIRYSREFDPKIGVNYNEVIDIYEDQRDRLWITTNGGGLYEYNYTKDDFERVDPDHGLKSTILSVLDDDEGNLWMGTYYGIGKYDPEKGTTIYFNKYDGLQGTDFKSSSKLRSSTGEFYFGGSNGLNIFRPEEILEDTLTYPVAVTDFLLFHEEVVVGDEINILDNDIIYQKSIVLGHDQNTVSFGYSALDFSFPKRNKYAYLLDGFDEHWNYVSDQRKATYTNLPPGQYTFKVMSTNNEGIWGENYSSIKLTIIPPFWQMWWFRLLILGSIISMIYMIIYLRTRQLKKQNIGLEEKVRERTQKLDVLVKELQEKKDEIEATNEELKSTLDDLFEQKKQGDQVNKMLEETHEELKTMNSELDRRVRERTSKLLKANKELDRFVYSASHDLSAPLKSILGLINITKTENKNKELVTHLKHMEDSVKKLEGVIKGLTQFSRNMGHEIIKEEIVFDNLVEEVLHELKTQNGIEELKIIKDYDLKDSVMTDYLRLKIILTNIMSNAFKYRDRSKSGSWVQINLRSENGTFEFEIKDNGIGMDSEIRKNIFNMFYRGTTLSDGSGLGLYIVKETIDKLGGKVNVLSEPGEFTTFRIKLPKL